MKEEEEGWRSSFCLIQILQNLVHILWGYYNIYSHLQYNPTDKYADVIFFVVVF